MIRPLSSAGRRTASSFNQTLLLNFWGPSSLLVRYSLKLRLIHLTSSTGILIPSPLRLATQLSIKSLSFASVFLPPRFHHSELGSRHTFSTLTTPLLVGWLVGRTLSRSCQCHTHISHSHHSFRAFIRNVLHSQKKSTATLPPLSVIQYVSCVRCSFQ